MELISPYNQVSQILQIKFSRERERKNSHWFWFCFFGEPQSSWNREQSLHAEESRAKTIIGDTSQSLDQIQSETHMYQPGWFQQHNKKPNCLNVEMSNLRSRNPSGRNRLHGHLIQQLSDVIKDAGSFHFSAPVSMVLHPKSDDNHQSYPRPPSQPVGEMDIYGSTCQKWEWFFLHVAWIQTGIGLPNPEPLIVIIEGVGRGRITRIGLN